MTMYFIRFNDGKAVILNTDFIEIDNENDRLETYETINLFGKTMLTGFYKLSDLSSVVKISDDIKGDNKNE